MYLGLIGLTTLLPCVPLGTISTFNLTSLSNADIEIGAPEPCPPEYPPTGEQVVPDIANIQINIGGIARFTERKLTIPKHLKSQIV